MYPFGTLRIFVPRLRCVRALREREQQIEAVYICIVSVKARESVIGMKHTQRLCYRMDRIFQVMLSWFFLDEHILKR